MKRKTVKKAEVVLPRVDVSRRRFTRKLIGAAFAVPTMMSFALDEVAFGAAAQLPSGGLRVFPTFLTSRQLQASCPPLRYYCVPEDPARRLVTPMMPTWMPSAMPSL